jgi:hypothetical protein
MTAAASSHLLPAITLAVEVEVALVLLVETLLRTTALTAVLVLLRQ